MNLERLRRAPNIAIVGSSSPLGKELKEMIDSSAFPVGKLSLLETEEYAGLLQEFAGEIRITQILSPEYFSDVDIAFFACGPEIMSAYASSGSAFPELTIDLTQTRDDGCLFLSGVSDPGLIASTGYFINPHPATIVLSRILSRLRASFQIQSAAITVLQPASERGSAGVDELQQQTVALLNFQQVENRTFSGQLAFNLLSEPANSRMTEQLLRTQIQTLLGDSTPLPGIMVVQAPVFHSHSFSIFLKLNESPGVDEIAACLRESRGAIAEVDAAASPISVVGSETIHLGRLIADPSSPGVFALWVVADNLRIAAHNALQIAESITLATTAK